MILRLALWILLVPLTSCALLTRPEPMTTLQLLLPDYADATPWPEYIQLDPVHGVAALQTNRVLVADGALLMQHEGLRWVETPAVMLTEQMQLRTAYRTERALAHSGRGIRLELWLTEFNIRIAADGGKSIVVAASTELKCSDPSLSHRRPLITKSEPIIGSDPRNVAQTFSVVTSSLIEAVLADAITQAEICNFMAE
jgi:hypothetical protein